MSDDKHGDSRSGWCLTRHCEDCERPECPHDCPHPKRANHVAAQAETGGIGYTVGGKDERPPAVTEDRSSHSESTSDWKA